jgi:hypothetical protein
VPTDAPPGIREGLKRERWSLVDLLDDWSDDYGCSLDDRRDDYGLWDDYGIDYYDRFRWRFELLCHLHYK